MPPADETDFGVVNFMPIETCVDPYRGLDAETLAQKLIEKYTSPNPKSVRDWPRVQTAIPRNGMFVVETTTPSFDALNH